MTDTLTVVDDRNMLAVGSHRRDSAVVGRSKVSEVRMTTGEDVPCVSPFRCLRELTRRTPRVDSLGVAHFPGFMSHRDRDPRYHRAIFWNFWLAR